LELSRARFADVAVITVNGRIDHANAEDFKSRLWPLLATCTATGDKLVLDLSGLEYISSAGLRVMMLAAREAKTTGGTLVVSSLQPVVREIFDISRFNVVFRVFADARAALGALSERAAAAQSGA
jgi:anti-sigma B factor antagonist